MSKLILMPVIDKLGPLTPAVMYEAVAAKYVKLGIHDFRKLVDAGVIPFRTHPGRTRRIYLTADLDEYLSRLPRGRIPTSEDSPSSEERGALR
jgi:excisionase family DNA binding protein